MKKSWHLDRRHMLRGIGATVALPLLEAMLPNSRALAKEAREIAPSAGALGAEGQRVRFTGVFMPNGFDHSRFTPKRSNLDELSPILSPLEGLQDYLNVVTNMRAVGGHALGTSGMLTGVTPIKTANASDLDVQSPSLDQIIGQATRHTTGMSSLELATHAPRTGVSMNGFTEIYSSFMSYRSKNTPVPPEIDPLRAFNRLFKNARLSSDTSTKKKASNTVAPDKSVLDLVLENAKSLQRRLGHSDKQKLEEYLTAVREIEQQTTNASANNKDLQITSDVLSQISSAKRDIQRSYGDRKESIKTVPDLSYQDHIRLQFEIIALALWSNSTRAATFMFGDGLNTRNVSFIEGVSGNHHTISHHGNKKENLETFSKINTFFVAEYANFLRRLEGMKEGSSNVLENSVCYMSSNISSGQQHSGNNMPAIIAGHAGGSLRGNRHVDAKGASSGNALRSVLHEMKIRAKLGDSNDRLSGMT